MTPNKKNDINLSAINQTFEWWSTHAESEEGEHGSNHESERKHSTERKGGEREHKGEHNKREGREHN